MGQGQARSLLQPSGCLVLECRFLNYHRFPHSASSHAYGIQVAESQAGEIPALRSIWIWILVRYQTDSLYAQDSYRADKPGNSITFTSIMRFFALKSAKNPDTTCRCISQINKIQAVAYNILDDITSGFWSVIEINIGVIVISLPPLRTLLSRQFSFFNRSRNRTDRGPYHAHSDEPSQLVTIGGSGPRSQTRKKGEPDGSEEDLVTGVNGVRVMDGSILKKTEFVISEGSVREGDGDDQGVLKPWENHAR